MGLLIPIILGLGFFTMVVFLRKYENDERMAMIEKGLDPNVPKPVKSSGVLRFALLAIGIGLGFLLGSFLSNTDAFTSPVGEFSMTFVFGGIGLLLAYLIEQKQKD